jgi:hypothetical protein
MTRRMLARVLLGAAGLGISGCGESPQTYRYRLTLEVETPEGVKGGAGVIEVRTWQTHFEDAQGGAIRQHFDSQLLGVAA